MTIHPMNSASCVPIRRRKTCQCFARRKKRATPFNIFPFDSFSPAKSRNPAYLYHGDLRLPQQYKAKSREVALPECGLLAASGGFPHSGTVYRELEHLSVLIQSCRPDRTSSGTCAWRRKIGAFNAFTLATIRPDFVSKTLKAGGFRLQMKWAGSF
jgi:hypothetical protein